MFSLFKAGPEAPPYLCADDEAPIRPDTARLAAWARALDDSRPSPDPPYRSRRQCRGALPDVDWANAEPIPPRRSVLRLIVGALAARMVPLASLGDTAPRPLGDQVGGDALAMRDPAPVALRLFVASPNDLADRAA